MIRVLNILTDSNIGGAGRVFLQYLKHIDRSRFQIYAAVPSGSKLVSPVKDAGCRIIETEYGRDKTYEIGAVEEYRRVIGEIKPDVVHTHASLAGRIAAYLCNVRCRVSTRHSVFETPRILTRFPVKQIHGIANNILSTDIIAVCKAAEKELCATGVDRRKITVVLNGTEPVKELSLSEKERFRECAGIGRDDFVVLMSARLESYKGHSYAVSAAHILRKKIGERKIRFVFMGDGSERDSLERQCRELGVEDMIVFTGFAEDTTPWYNISDVVLNASYAEAASLSLCEGMSLGKPLIATDFGGNTELVIHGENGLIIPPMDSYAIAKAILSILNDSKLYSKLSRGAAERYARDFTAKAMTDKIMKVYEKSSGR